MLMLGQAEWQAELKPFTTEQIHLALRQFKGEYPPSLPALVDACRQRKLHRRFRALPKPAVDPEVVLSVIRAMRSAVSRG